MRIPPERYNVATMLDANIDAGRADKIAIYCEDQRITYAQLLATSCRFANALAGLGVGREQRVLMVMGDTPDFPAVFFGAIRLGAVPVPVNPRYRPADYRFFAEDSDAQVVVVDEDLVPTISEAFEGMPHAPNIVSSGEAEFPILRLADLLATQPDTFDPAPTHRDDMAFWLYSSGSTGNPKGVVHLQRDIPYTCETYASQIWDIREDDIVFSRVLFHAYGLGNALTFPIWAGASTVLDPRRPTPENIMQTVERFRPTIFGIVPTLYNAILNTPACVDADLASVRLCVSAAEPLPPETFRRWQETYGAAILDGIGSTEMLHIFCSNSSSDLRPGSSGKPVPGYSLRIVDEEGQDLPSGETGNLLVRGGSAAPFYWHRRERSQQTMLGEWVFTGDRYRRDDDGFYWYEGRADDMMKVAGEWVSPIEIENTLLEHPRVDEAAVVGIPVDGVLRIKAVIIPRDGPASDELTVALQEWCKERLQRFQYPHLVEYVTELPKTLTGKIQRYRLREDP
ncbi:MAG: benzoate-CoA ligase family protein [Chloroflexi bacterium]|nr:benzoate-CoA ligase family protein [Chloroflexota bacterium]